MDIQYMTAEINNELNSFLSEIAGAYRVERQPGDFSVYEFAAETGLSIPQCTKILNDLTSQGRLVKVNGRSANSRRMNLYRKPS